MSVPLKFSPGSFITHILFKKNQRAVLRKSVRSHIGADIGDWIIIRALDEDTIVIEKLEVPRLDIDKESLISSLIDQRVTSDIPRSGDR